MAPRSRSILLSAFLAAILGISSAHPSRAQQEASDSAIRWFDGIDVDKDGLMTAAEMTGVRDKRFDRTDGNGDGVITADEYVFGIPEHYEDVIERRRNRHAAMDRDGDGVVPKEEYMLFGERVIEVADLDGDGKVSRAEFADSVATDQNQ